MSNDDTVSFEDLSWGRGDKLFEIFVEPTCPHSGRAFGKLMPLLDEVGHDNLKIRIWLNSQPWHTFSSVVSRAILAASGAQGGRQAAFEVLAAVFANRQAYVLEGHSSGTNLDASPAGILDRIAGHSGHDLREPFERMAVTGQMKKHARYSRQNGIHGTPTFMVDGLVNDGIGSRDEIGEWTAELGIPS